MSLRKRIRNLRRRVASAIEPERIPALPPEAKYGCSIHDGQDERTTDPRALAYWDSLVKPDPSAKLDDRPIWFRTIGDKNPLTASLVDQMRERQQAGYRVSFAVYGDQRHGEDALRVMEDRYFVPEIFAVGNEPDLEKDATAASVRKDFAWLPGFYQKAREVFARISWLAYKTATDDPFRGIHFFANPGLVSVRHAIGDFGRMWGELLSDFDVAPKLHSYGHIRPEYWVRFDLARLVRRNMGSTDQAPVLLEEAANDFLGHLKEPTPEKIESVTGFQAEEYARTAMLAGCQAGIYVGHFLLARHSVNGITHPLHGIQRQRGLEDAVELMERTGTPGTLADLELEDPRGRPFPLDAGLAELEAWASGEAPPA